MAMKQSEILGLFTSPADVQAMQQERISQEASMYSDPIARQMYQSAAGVTGGVAGLFGGQPTGAAEAAKIEEIRKSVPFDVENQSQYYTQLGQTLINQGLTKAGIQSLELAKQAKLDEAKAAKDQQAMYEPSVDDKKAMRGAVENARKSRLKASQAKSLRDRFLREAPVGGVLASAFGAFKKFIGGQDNITSLRNDYEAIRVADGMTNLPPGPASDKDVEMAMGRFPTKTDSASYIAQFLNGMHKMSAIDAEYQDFYASYLEKNRGIAAGVDEAWKAYAEELDWKTKHGITWTPKTEGTTEDATTPTETMIIDGIEITVEG